ncbi:MAG TPA: redoxin domain-containing protein [Candidatus Dormibacteraeota bacterium]
MSPQRIALAGVGILLAAAITYGVISRNQTITPAATASSSDTSLPVGPQAPDFTGVTGWVNSQPLTIQQLRGKVVLVDFWTYSCINCQRTIPALRTWWQRYQAEGLVIVGVHSPEFDFEKDPGNVRRAVKELGVEWPVALDPNMATWNAYQNQYWPAEYLIDKQGFVRHTHFGEGEYDVTEHAIRTLLGEKGSVAAAQAQLPGNDITAEAYAGSDRADGRITLSGSWSEQPQFAVSGGSGGAAAIQFTATHVFLVAGAAGPPVEVLITIDGRSPSTSEAGLSVHFDSAGRAFVTVGAHDLYSLLSLPSEHSHQLQIRPLGAMQLFTFTFG